MAPKTPKGRLLGTRERSELFTNRRNRQATFQFGDIDPALLVTALNVACQNGATLSFAGAQGGIGVTMRVYRGDNADVEFAGSPLELAELLMLLVEGLAGGSDDMVHAQELYMEQRRKTTIPG